MRKLLLILLCFVPLRAFASSADSGICPWKLPFAIKVHAVGTKAQSYTSYGKFSPTLDSQDFEVSVDTNLFAELVAKESNVHTGYSLRNDTLTYYYSYTGQNDSSHSVSVVVAFVPGKDSVLSIIAGRSADWSSISQTSRARDSGAERSDFQIFSLSLDDSSLYFSNAAGARRPMLAIQRNFKDASSQDWSSYEFTGLTFTLSGIFRSLSITTDSTFRPSPWTVPFQIHVSADGWNDSLGRRMPMSINYWLMCNASYIDSNILLVSYDSTFSVPNIFVVGTFRSALRIVFIPGTDSIASLSLAQDTTISQDPDENLISDNGNFSLQISGLNYDTSSIFTSDSSFCDHNINITSYHESWFYSSYYYFSFTATSASLSGIFRPTHYTCAESVSDQPRENALLRVYSFNNSIECSFSASSEPRRADVYSVLGTEIAHSQIPAGATEAMIGDLTQGFYFVKLGNEVAKAIIP